LILLWLALGTWATIFYDIWKLVQNLGSKKPEAVEEQAPTIWYDLPVDEEKDDKD
jgi:hypothetical protein